MREISKIIIHCSDSDYPKHDNIHSIREWHVDEKGWSDVGYHWVILKSGHLSKGRPEEIQGAGVKGHNEDSIHICLTGKYIFADVQFVTLWRQIKTLKRKFPEAVVYAHNYFDNSKSCPNFVIHDKLKNFYGDI